MHNGLSSFPSACKLLSTSTTSQEGTHTGFCLRPQLSTRRFHFSLHDRIVPSDSGGRVQIENAHHPNRPLSSLGPIPIPIVT